MSWALLVPVAVVALLARQMFKPRAFKQVMRRWGLLLHGWRWPLLVHSVGLLVLVVVAAMLLSFLHPWFNVGWWSIMGGQGNVVFGTMASDPTPAASGASATAFRFEPAMLLPLMLIPLLAFLAPRLVWEEETMFRGATWIRTVSEQWRSALKFGLLHMIMGIPLAAGLALTLAGMGFTWAYTASFNSPGAASPAQSRRRALRAAARLHLTYNLVIMGLVFAGLVLTPWME